MGEMYKNLAGLQMVQVNYKTMGDSLNDLMTGTLDVAFADAAYSLREQQNGRMRILAVSTAARTKAMSDIPTMAEGGVPGIDITVWWATMVPSGTPPAIKERLRGWFDQILRTDETEKFLRSIGTDVFISTPAETSAFLAQDIKRWGEYVQIAKIQAE
jgi:tripartite-type tricarboxylate transporter receptor subunit TctC